jgi:hypothetical protein
VFGKKPKTNALEPPPIASKEPEAVEVLRVWALPGHPQQLTLRTTWKDAGAWGLLLVDIARHAAQAYELEGEDPKAVLARIRELFEAEWKRPTDDFAAH